MFSDPPCTWDDVISNRCIYLEFIEDKYYRAQSENAPMDVTSFFMNKDDDDYLSDNFYSVKNKMLKKLEYSKLLMKINFAQAAQFQGNHKLALNKLNQTKFILKEPAKDWLDLQIIWMHCYLNTHLIRCKVVNSSEDGLNMFLNAMVLREIKKFDQYDEYSVRIDLFQDQQLLHGKISKFLIDILTRIHNNSDNTNYYEKLSNDEKKWTQLVDYIKSSDITNLEEV